MSGHSILGKGVKVPGKFYRIPRAQQVLLDREDAWMSDIPNTPNEVLENLKAFHARRLAPARQSTAASNQPGNTALDKPASSRSSSRKHVVVPDDGEGSDSGTPISGWDSSPERPPERHGHLPRSPVPSSSTAHHKATAMSVSCPKTRFLSQKHQKLKSSCSEEAAVVEAREPEPAAHRVPPFYRKALLCQPAPTPPSAQIPVIPSTISEQTSSSGNPPPTSTTFEGPILTTTSRPQPMISQEAGSEIASRRRKSRRLRQHWYRGPVPPFLIPSQETKIPGHDVSAVLATQESSPMASSKAAPGEYVPTETQYTSSKSECMSEAGREVLPVAEKQPEWEIVRPRNDDHSQGQSSEKLPPNGPPSQVPFTAFKVLYPDYTGNLSDFLRSLLCIERLQSKKSLPVFLFDDFVRVFSLDYLDYIQGLHDEEQPLTASQYYNDEVPQPRYTKGFLRKDNIQEILGKYAKEVHDIKASLLGEDQTANSEETGANADAKSAHEDEGTPAARPSKKKAWTNSSPIGNSATTRPPPTILGESDGSPEVVSVVPVPEPSRNLKRSFNELHSDPIEESDPDRLPPGKRDSAKGETAVSELSVAKETPPGSRMLSHPTSSSHGFKTQPDFPIPSLQSIGSPISPLEHVKALPTAGSRRQTVHPDQSAVNPADMSRAAKSHSFHTTSKSPIPFPRTSVPPELEGRSKRLRAGLDLTVPEGARAQGPMSALVTQKPSHGPIIQSTPVALPSANSPGLINADSIPETLLRPKPPAPAVSKSRDRTSSTTSSSKKKKKVSPERRAQLWKEIVEQDKRKKAAGGAHSK